jgi:L-alanine-DL-glutamate epimerase-like enolase superfamily enzyme
VANNVLVRITLADGTVGLGEGAPFTAVSGETQKSTLDAAHSARCALLGRDGRSYRSIAGELADNIRHAPAARCAIEIALFDALVRHFRMPLWAFFGGCGTAIETDMTVTAGDVDHASRAAQAILARGISMIKVKVGALSAEEDAQRLAAVKKVAPESPLLIDANGGYTPSEAVRLLDRLNEMGVALELFEQPVAPHDWAEFRRRAAGKGVGGKRVAVCADESARSAADVLALVRDDAVEAVNIKPMKYGVVESLAIWNVARAAGLELMIGGMLESSLSMSFSVHFAAGLVGFSYGDLDTPMFF